MENYRKHPYRGIFSSAAKLLGITGTNAPVIARNRYSRGQGEVVAVVNKLAAQIEKRHSRRLAELNELIERDAV